MVFEMDLEGRKYEKGKEIVKPLIDEDAYDGKVTGFKLIEGRNYDNANEIEEKIICSITTDNGHVLPYFFTPKIKKAPEGSMYQNSTLYDLLSKAGLLYKIAGLHGSEAITNSQELVDWLNTSVVGMDCRILTRTVHKGKPEAYSAVKEIIRFKSGESKT